MPRTMSSGSITYNSMAGHERMDPEVRAHVQSLSTSTQRLCRLQLTTLSSQAASTSFTNPPSLRMFTSQRAAVKTVWNPNLLAGDARQTRAAAMLSLLEATEDGTREMLLKSNGRTVKNGELKESKQSKEAENNNAKTADSDSEHTSLDYGVKPTDKKERGFMPWRKSGNSFRSDSNYIRVERSFIQCLLF